MKTTAFLKWVILLMVFLGISFMVHLCGAMAQTPQKPPEVSLTIYIVPEKIACFPHGYKDYDSGKSSNCKPLTMDDLPKLRKALQTESVPPSAIKLNEALSGILNAYRTAGRSTPEKRRSIVLVFEWNTPISAHVSLERKIKGECAVFPPMIWPGDLNQERHWFHHERADAFLPGYEVEWILKVGEYQWDFHTE